MLSSIHPLGERARHNRWAITLSAFLSASTAAGTAAGALAGTVGLWLRPLLGGRPGLVGALGAAAAVGAAGWDWGVGRSLGWHRQVNEDWLGRYRGWVYGAGFGAQLGAGGFTIITTALVPLVGLLGVLSLSPGRGAVIGAAFGLSRALPLVLVGRVRSAESLRRFHLRMARAAGRARAGAAGTAAAGALVLAVGLWR